MISLTDRKLNLPLRLPKVSPMPLDGAGVCKVPCSAGCCPLAHHLQGHTLQTVLLCWPNTCKALQVNVVEAALNARCRRVFANAHTYHINSVSISSDGESFISSDDLRVNLWHMEHSNQSFNIVDMKPANMEDLTEVSVQPDTPLLVCIDPDI